MTHNVRYCCEISKSKKNFNSKAKRTTNHLHEKLLTKIDNFPLSLNSKINLKNLVASDKILDVIRVVEKKNGSLTLLGRINMDLKAFSNLDMESDEVLIKVLSGTNTKSYEYFGYTKNSPTFSRNSTNIGLYFNREPLTILRNRNVIVMKKMQYAKTLEEISKDPSENVDENFGEVLQQIHDIRSKDETFWKHKINLSKMIRKWNGRWIFINILETDTPIESQNERLFTVNVSKLLELFYSYGVSESELKCQFLKVFRSFQWTCVEWKRYTSIVIMEKYFTPLECLKKSRRKEKVYFRKNVK